jgi:ADP-ribosyl-[dinitrogen reductase] hydrolase
LGIASLHQIASIRHMPNQLPVLGKMLPGINPGGVDYAIATAVLAYATGDAFGVSYEFEPLVSAPIPKVMLGKADWPAGGVSDDTLLSLMTIACLSAETPELAAEEFVSRLRAAAPNLRGMGPTTRHALGIFVEEREVGIIGVTNGGMMRTALVGLAFGGLRNPDRQTWVGALCSATHGKSEARFAALLMAEIFASALELPDWDIDKALRIARQNVAGLPVEISARLDSAEEFETAPAGVSLNPIETLLAVISIVRKSPDVWNAYENAICAGGDTDTLAALASALVALRNPNSFYELPFINDVNWAEIPELPERVASLLTKRAES